MALVEWAPGQTQFQGKYLGSAFGVSKTGLTLFRNPTAANNLHARQTLRRWAWSLAQREYKNLDPAWLPILTECGQNNPHVNARGDVRYPNRYHKYLQVAVFWLILEGNLPLFYFPDISTPYSVGVTDAYAFTYFEGGTGQQVVAINFGLSEPVDMPEGHALLLYMSRPVSHGVTTWHGSWYNVQVDDVTVDRWQADLFLGDLATSYQLGDRIIVQWHWLDYYRAFLGSVQQQSLVITSLV